MHKHTSNVGTERENRNSVPLQIVMQLKDTKREAEIGEEKKSKSKRTKSFISV